MRLRSLLFVPGDRPDRFPKAAASGADALILDLEDSVAFEKKEFARAAVTEWLAGNPPLPCFVRVNSLDSGLIAADIDGLGDMTLGGIVLPKSECAASVTALVALCRGRNVPILPIATETPDAIFHLGSYGTVADHLAGLTWGVEDLPAAIGATSSRNADGSYTAPYEMVRALTLFGAHAAGIPAIETVYPRLHDIEGLAAYVARARRDGFTGMMALHPTQVAVIHAGFTPSGDEIARAQAIVKAFEANPGAGVLRLYGEMVDTPHLTQALRLIQNSAA